MWKLVEGVSHLHRSRIFRGSSGVTDYLRPIPDGSNLFTRQVSRCRRPPSCFINRLCVLIRYASFNSRCAGPTPPDRLGLLFISGVRSQHILRDGLPRRPIVAHRVTVGCASTFMEALATLATVQKRSRIQTSTRRSLSLLVLCLHSRLLPLDPTFASQMNLLLSSRLF